MYGGFQFVTSQGEPGKTAKARDTIVSALAGLAIAVVAAILVGFIAGRF
jgi:ABC-type nitrate/sulfonate/bicarbonate transport system permease component